MTYLLDVNVLIALVDPTHVTNERAGDWFAENCRQGWATCPITQNAVVRIVGNPSYPNSPGGTSAVAKSLSELLTWAGHEFWPDDISLLDNDLIDPRLLSAHKHTTDTYLLGLAVKHDGRLVTFDRRLSTQAVIGGAAALVII